MQTSGNLTSLKPGFLFCKMGMMMPTSVGGGKRLTQKITGYRNAMVATIMEGSKFQYLQREPAMAHTSWEIIKGPHGPVHGCWKSRRTSKPGMRTGAGGQGERSHFKMGGKKPCLRALFQDILNFRNRKNSDAQGFQLIPTGQQIFIFVVILEIS